MKRAALAAVAILALTACGPEPWDNPTNRDPRVGPVYLVPGSQLPFIVCAGRTLLTYRPTNAWVLEPDRTPDAPECVP